MMDTTSLVSWTERVEGGTALTDTFSMTSNPEKCFGINPCIKIIGTGNGLFKQYIEQTLDSSKWSDVNFGIDVTVHSFDEDEYAFFETSCDGKNFKTNKFLTNRTDTTSTSKCFYRVVSCNELIVRIGAYVNGIGDQMWISQIVYEDPFDGSTNSPTPEPADMTQMPTNIPTLSPSADPSMFPTNHPSNSTDAPTNIPSNPPSLSPTKSQTWPCAQITLTINGAASFNVSQFDGLYVEHGEINGKQFWINEEAPNEKNIRFVNGIWIVNGKDTFHHLEFKMNKYGQGTYTYSEDGSTGTGQISCYSTETPTSAPSFSPTTNPTNSPLTSGQIDDEPSFTTSFISEVQPKIENETVDDNLWMIIAIVAVSMLILFCLCFICYFLDRSKKYKENAKQLAEMATNPQNKFDNVAPQSPVSLTKEGVADVLPQIKKMSTEDLIADLGINDMNIVNGVVFTPGHVHMRSLSSEILYVNDHEDNEENGASDATTGVGDTCMGSTDFGDV